MRGQSKAAYFNPVTDADGFLWVQYNGGLREEQHPNFRLIKFDWNLTPLAIYTLPESLINFAVDSRVRTIYGLTLIDGEAKVYKYTY